MLIHAITLTTRLLNDEDDFAYEQRLAWCDANAGICQKDWDVHFCKPKGNIDEEMTMDETFSFRDKDVALLFKLTWGGA